MMTQTKTKPFIHIHRAQSKIKQQQKQPTNSAYKKDEHGRLEFVVEPKIMYQILAVTSQNIKNIMYARIISNLQ